MDGSTPSVLLEFLNPAAVPRAVLVILLAFVLVRFVDRTLRRLSEQFTRQRLLLGQATAIFAFTCYSLAGLTAFGMVFNLSSEALLAVSGTVAVTLGFAFKDVAASLMAGLSILTNKPFTVGDRISFGGYYGEVKEIGLRTIRLVTLDDNLVTIPSNKFLTDPVASANAGQLDCMVVMPFFIDATADHRRAKEIVREALLASKFLFLGKPMAVLIGNRLSEQGPLGHRADREGLRLRCAARKGLRQRRHRPRAVRLQTGRHRASNLRRNAHYRRHRAWLSSRR